MLRKFGAEQDLVRAYFFSQYYTGTHREPSVHKSLHTLEQIIRNVNIVTCLLQLQLFKVDNLWYQSPIVHHTIRWKLYFDYCTRGREGQARVFYFFRKLRQVLFFTFFLLRQILTYDLKYLSVMMTSHNEMHLKT